MGPKMRRSLLFAFCAAAASGIALTSATALAAPQDDVGPAVPMRGQVSAGEAVLYDNTPVGAETVFTTTSVPRTGGADEALFNGAGALLTSLQFGYSVATGGPAAFDARIRFFDDINLTAGAGTPQFQNQVGQITVPFTAQVAGAFITNPVSLTGQPGGGVTVTPNPANLGVPNVTDVYVQVDFFQPGTTTPVANNAVTYIFDGSGVNAGLTFASPAVGGNGTATDEVYWRDVSNNGVIEGDEARNFTAPNRANFVLKLEGNIIPEPASLGLVALAGLATLRRRRRGA
jgi:hypothetical protein